VGVSYPFFLSNFNYYHFNICVYLLMNVVQSKVRVQRSINLNISRLIDLDTYQGIRHAKKLPVRGQRTKTNAQTVKKQRFKNL